MTDNPNHDKDLVEAVQRFQAPVFQYTPTTPEILFARYFALSGDLYNAYLQANLPTKATDTKASITAKSSRLLATERVQERYQYFRQLIETKMDCREDRVVAELSALAFADPADFYDPATGKLLPINKIPPHARAAIKTYDPENNELQLYDKNATLKTVVAIKNMDGDNKEAQAPKIVIGAGMAQLAQQQSQPKTIDVTPSTPTPTDEDILG